MCDDHAAQSPAEDERPGISRRAVLSGAVAAGVAATGKIVGLSNPVWLLRSAPPGGVPARRAA